MTKPNHNLIFAYTIIKRDFFFDRIVTFQNLEMSAIVTFCQESCFFLRS